RRVAYAAVRHRRLPDAQTELPGCSGGAGDRARPACRTVAAPVAAGLAGRHDDLPAASDLADLHPDRSRPGALSLLHHDEAQARRRRGQRLGCSGLTSQGGAIGHFESVRWPRTCDLLTATNSLSSSRVANFARFAVAPLATLAYCIPQS